MTNIDWSIIVLNLLAVVGLGLAAGFFIWIGTKFTLATI